MRIDGFKSDHYIGCCYVEIVPVFVFLFPFYFLIVCEFVQ